MKKRLLVFAMIACILGLTGCGASAEKTSFMTEEEAISAGEVICDTIAQLDANGMTPDLLAEYPAYAAGLESYQKASADFGGYVGVVSGLTEVELGEKEVIINVTVQGDKEYKPGKTRQAKIEVILTSPSQDGISTITTNLIYDMSELMYKACMNTLLGMGIVFTVLILISVLIYCFNFIPAFLALFEKKPSKEEVKAEAVDNTIAQITEMEESVDDLELIAVISAAIAAAEGSASTDGYVVRSIIRR